MTFITSKPKRRTTPPSPRDILAQKKTDMDAQWARATARLTEIELAIDAGRIEDVRRLTMELCDLEYSLTGDAAASTEIVRVAVARLNDDTFARWALREHGVGS
jgi:hypothetical protein